MTFVSSKSFKNEAEGGDLKSRSSEFKKKWETASNFIKKSVRHPIYIIPVNIFERSIFPSCVEKKLADFNMTEQFNTFIKNIDSLHHFDEMKFGLMYFATGILCSDKVRPIQEFFFDMIMSFGHLVRAFMDEPELKEYFFFLRCANSYVIRKNYWDNNEYPINSQLNEHERNYCQILSDRVEETLFGHFKVSSDESDCLDNIMEKTIPFEMRKLLLAQVELSPQKLNAEKEKIFEKKSQLREQDMKCLLPLVMEMDAEDFQALNRQVRF